MSTDSGRLPGTDRVDEVIADLYTARSLADALQAVADGALAGLGYSLAAVNLVRPDGDLVVAACAGDPTIEARVTGRVGSRDAWERRLSQGQDWGGPRFVPYSADPSVTGDDIPDWRNERTALDHRGAHDLGDRFYAPMYASGNGPELLGVLSMDRSHNSRALDAKSMSDLRKYAYHSALAISNARLRANMQRALVRLEREQQALRASEQSFRDAFEHAPSGMAIAEMGGGQQGRLLRVNDSLCRLLGRTASTLRRYSFLDLVHPEDIATLLNVSAEGGRAELRLARRDGTYVWVLLRNGIVADSTDGPRFLLANVEDIEKRRQYELGLLQRASIDDLTGLRTESELRSLLNQQLCDRGAVEDTSAIPAAPTGFPDRESSHPSQAHSHKELPAAGDPSLAILRLGLDDFKIYNTNHGRAAGDDALREIAIRLRSALAEWGHEFTLGRVRGDEYMVLAPDLDDQQAQALTERLQKVCRRPLPNSRSNDRWSPSMTSVICWAVCGQTADDVLRESDNLLHQHKISRAAMRGL
ncbi:diguanylate cyclase domain-containing protein [Streptomyces sp. NPDC056387]|uniref:GGDEF domain-containing protein n=1 Tax=Streptomyces sp. NPDC056387 TaxID=3345803 RepID=UPI0035DB38BA